MPVAGIDVGSLTAEVVILEQDKILDYVIMPTGSNSRFAAERVMEAALQSAGIALSDLGYIIATGYGRVSIPFAHKCITEITCHGRGAYFIDARVRTVIDIGGQDSKVIRLSEKGRVLDFAMNDKCAAGTGRFFEVMAQVLEVELDQLSVLSTQAASSVSISSMCTVFAESEVVSLIAQGLPREDIARGLYQAVAERTAGLVNRVGLEEAVMFTGGVAKNMALVLALSGKFKVEIIVPPEPQIIGALGAALLAQDELESS
ncbi:MAG TPA: acyl-CoA dehydratase activase [Candidatus Limnocylindrales bacterium]|nr:acyl-CoA dehydratase activase [Candidatus Limnocylindrales bacterium]